MKVGKLNDEDYNSLIVKLFANDGHTGLLKRMCEHVTDANKEEFISYLDSTRSETISGELIQKIEERAEYYASKALDSFSNECLAYQLLNESKPVKDAYCRALEICTMFYIVSNAIRDDRDS